MKKIFKYSIVFLLIFVISALTVAPVASAEDYEKVPYNTYTYWSTNQGLSREAAPIRSLFAPVDRVTGYDLGTDEMSEPTDLDTDSAGNLYVLDSGNSRVLVLNPALELLHIVEAPTVKDETLDFSSAQGLYVSQNDELYVCDTENGRILIFDAAGKFRQLIGQPVSNIVPKDFNFAPIKVVVDSRGYLFALSRGSYYGAVVYDPNGNFLGFYGANFVQATVLDALGKLWDRLTQTEAKRAASTQKLPYQFISMDIDSNDFIYTLTGLTDEIYSAGTGQIRRLNPSGSNIYKNSSGNGSEMLVFTDEGNYQTDGLTPYLTDFVKLCTDENDFVYAVDATFGHIFIYDSQCNCIGVFGDGGKNFAGQFGTFDRPSSITVSGDALYVADAEDCSVTSFRITDYGKLYMQAQSMTLKGNYTESKPLWEQVLAQDKNNQLAYWGLAQAALFEHDYSAAMRYAKTGKDQVDYAVAFQQKRSEFFANNVWWILILVVVLIVALVILKWVFRNRKKNPDNPVRFAFNTVVHPFDSFYRLKYKGAGSLRTCFILLALYYISMVCSDIYAGFSFSIFNAKDYNSLLTLVKSVGLVIGFSLINWAVCMLAQGKGRLKEIFMACCYAIIPEIFACVLKLILTNVLVPEEESILTLVLVCCHILTAIMLCVGIMAVHEYDFFRFLWTTVLTVLGILLVVFIIFMIFILTRELFAFVDSIVKEALYK